MLTPWQTVVFTLEIHDQNHDVPPEVWSSCSLATDSARAWIAHLWTCEPDEIDYELIHPDPDVHFYAEFDGATILVRQVEINEAPRPGPPPQPRADRPVIDGPSI